MPKQTIPYLQTGYFSQLICDYLAQADTTRPFYNRFPELSQFGEQLKEKKTSFSQETRATLVDRLAEQYKDCVTSPAVRNNIDSLASDHTFTVTTGHQLNLFTGPLYFLYKIFSVINLSEQLKQEFPDHHFVPIFWMASEDHDFDEINYFQAFGKRLVWERSGGGAVGELSTEGLGEVAQVLHKVLGGRETSERLHSLFSEAYTSHSNLADATRYLGNALFQDHGLVIVDGNDCALKKEFIPFARLDLLENRSYDQVTKTTSSLVHAGYKEQVHPREINLFYLKQGVRERIILKDHRYYVNNTEQSFSEEEILAELDEHPERFSPNALMRPLYQEVILPNICYTGGGGELAYWFQLKDYFESVSIPFPILLLRNSVMLASEKLLFKLKKLNVPLEMLFLKREPLRSAYTRQLSSFPIDFSKQREHLSKQFEALYELAKETDASFVGAVGAQEKKQLNGLDRLEKRLLRAQKRKLAEHLDRLSLIQDSLFPGGGLQERNTNFSEFYVEYGNDLFAVLKEQLDPLSNEFTVLQLP